jgi:Domain of unknown function (DUF1963)
MGRRTTPDLRLELATIVPSLRDSFQLGIRLHPRPVTVPQTPAVSKVGGLFLWPNDEPWPVCHDSDIGRRDKVVHNEPFVPLLQLLKEDFPTFPFPNGTDVFQLLWCPYVHEFDDLPAGWSVYWRKLKLSEPFAEETPKASFNSARECSLTAEIIDDMPSWLEFAEKGETFGEAARRVLGDAADRYMKMGGAAPGLKLFGWPNWIQDPVAANCGCGQKMIPLLSIASSEFENSTFEYWCPTEDRQEHTSLISAYWQHPDPSRFPEFAIHQEPLGFCIGDSGSMYLLYCSRCPGPIIKAFVQSH